VVALPAARKQEIKTMSLNPEFDGIVAEAPPAPAPLIVVPPAYEAPALPVVPPWLEQPAAVQAPARKRRGWLVSASIAVVGIIASGTLGAFLYTTTQQRDAARHQLALTQSTLADTNQQLAARKAIDTYLNLYVSNSGRVTTEYENTIACDSYVTCRTAAQDLVTAMKAFQAARARATVPSALANADSQIGDALSAAIAGDQELITGMDTNDLAKIKDGGKKVDDAMLSFAKAESALASSLS
jgi:hypothetical protein